MFYPLPSSEIVNRERYLVGLCAGKNVIHLGAAQANDNNDMGPYGTTIDPATFLHSQISAVAARCVGVDYNKQGIDLLRADYGITNIYYANIEDENSLNFLDFTPDVVLLGEIIEHLMNPGLALTNIKNQLMSDESTLVATMPNAIDSSNFLYGLLRREAHDPDHVAYYSPRLFQRLCEKVDLRVTDVKYYQVTMAPNGRNYYRLDRLIPRKLFLFLYYNFVLRVSPGLSSGIIVLAKKVR